MTAIRTRLAASAALAAVILTAASGSAHATLALDLTKTDATGDVHTMTANKKPDVVRNSIDLRTVNYRIDRDTDVLTITYRTPTIFTPKQLGRRHIIQLFYTTIVTGNASFDIESTSRRTAVTISGGTCHEATSTTDTAADTLTQTVPLSCIEPDEGGLMSGTILLTAQGPLFSDTGAWLTHSFDLSTTQPFRAGLSLNPDSAAPQSSHSRLDPPMTSPCRSPESPAN